MNAFIGRTVVAVRNLTDEDVQMSNLGGIFEGNEAIIFDDGSFITAGTGCDADCPADLVHYDSKTGTNLVRVPEE